MNKKPVIAIDGYSSTGKSSISKEIAARLHLIHIDTGALYRGIAYYALTHFETNGKPDLKTLLAHLDEIHLEFKREDTELILYLNGKNIAREIRSPRVSEIVSEIAKLPEVRAFLLDIQRNMAAQGGVIMDGRDIGTVILPKADYKFFLTASIEERTRRRFLELEASGEQVTRESVRENLIERDKIDTERAVSPLKQAEDAILIDNSKIDKEETIELILSYIH